MQHVWDYKPAKNIISTENLRRIHEALKAGPVFGYWYRAHIGHGPVNWLARDFAAFHAVIERARPATYYVAWSLPALLAQNMALAAARYGDLPAGATSLFTPDDLRAIERYFSAPPRDPMREIFAIFLGGGARGPEALDIDASDLEYLAENAQWYCQPGGEGYVFPFTASQLRDSGGLLMNTIERPEYWLLDGWYPDELGRTPTNIEFG